MVIHLRKTRLSRSASLLTELLVAMAILAGVLVPLAWSLTSERRLARSLYQRAVAMEIVDGELEVLLAGGYKSISPGQHAYTPYGRAITNLPPGEFLVTVAERSVRLEWRPAARHHGGSVIREGNVP